MKKGILMLGLFGLLGISLASCNKDNNKPVEIPSDSTTSKPSDDIKQDEIVNSLSPIKIDSARHEYLKGEELSLSLTLESNDLANIDYRLLNDGSIIKKGSVSSFDGKAKLSISLDGLDTKRYILELSSTAIKNNIKSYFSFDVVSEIKNDSILSYDELKENGNFKSIVGHDIYSEEFLRENTLRGLGGYKINSYDGLEYTIDSFSKAKPTVLAFHTLGCASCKKGIDYLSKINIDSLNVLHIAVGLDSDTLELARDEALELSKESNTPLDSFYFDNVDSVWDDVLGYNSAPQYVFLNSYSEPIAFMSASNSSFNSYQSFYNEFNDLAKKAYNLDITEREEFISINVHYMDRVEAIRIKKGEGLQITPAEIKGYRFLGFKINDTYIDLNEYRFNDDVDLYLDYIISGISYSEIGSLDHALIDLRLEDDFNRGHLDNAINVSLKSFKNSFLDLKIDKSKTIILYGVDKPYEIMDYLLDKGYKSLYLMDYEIENGKKEFTYQERKDNNELDPYYNPHIESQILEKYYGLSYLDLSFIGFDKKSHSLNEYLYLDNKPTIVMVGSTTCLTCDYAFNRFIELNDKSGFNFVEVISYSRKQNVNDLIDSEKNKMGNDFNKKSPYKLFDNNRYSQDNSYTYLKAHELPVFYILDRLGNLTNVVSSFDKAMDYVSYLKDSISIENVFDNPNRTLEDRINSLELKHLENNEVLYNFILNNYASFMLRQSFYDYTHTVRNVNSFLDLNGFDKSKPLAIFIMNSKNSDFDSSVLLLDEIMKNSDMNILAIVDNNSRLHSELIMKNYSSKIMFDDYNTNVSEGYVLYEKSYFVILDSMGSLTNIALDYKALPGAYDTIRDTISVKSPNRLTKPSVIKPNDNVLSKDEAFNSLGFISHLDSVKDMARYEYLNINYGRNYLDLEVIDSNGSNVRLGEIIDPNKETIVCFLQSYMDDFYYAFNPLYKLKDKCNIIIVFTNRRDEPYNNQFVDDILALGTKKAIAKAREPQNIGGIIDIVKGENPTLSGEALDLAVDKYLENKYDYKKMKEFIYGSYAYLTTPLLETEVRGIQLYLDKNGNLASISQTYYAVGGVFETVLNKIHGYIAKED